MTAKATSMSLQVIHRCHCRCQVISTQLGDVLCRAAQPDTRSCNVSSQTQTQYVLSKSNGSHFGPREGGGRERSRMPPIRVPWHMVHTQGSHQASLADPEVCVSELQIAGKPPESCLPTICQILVTKLTTIIINTGIQIITEAEKRSS